MTPQMIEAQDHNLKMLVQQQKRFGKKRDVNLEFLEQCTEENPLGQRLNQISVGLVL